MTLIASLVMAAAAFLVATGTLAALGRVPLAAGAPLLNGLELMGPAIFFLCALASAATAFGLLRLQRWSRRAAIVVAAWVLASAIPVASAAVSYLRVWPLARSGATIIGCIMVIRYLMDGAVKTAFDSTVDSTTAGS